MPEIARVFIKSSLVYMVMGFILGALLQINKAYPVYPSVWLLRDLHIHWLLLGWFAQLAMGVAYWSLPRLAGGSRGSIIAGWACIIFFNAGLLIYAISQISLLTGRQSPPLLSISAPCLLISGVILYVFLMWPRIKALNLPTA